jgi:hypothetical protein
VIDLKAAKALGIETPASVLARTDVRRSEWVPKSFESNPTLVIHSDTSRACCRVVMNRPSPRLSVNRKSPDFLPAVFR